MDELTKACHHPEHIQYEWAGELGFHDKSKASQEVQQPNDPQECIVCRHDVGLLTL